MSISSNFSLFSTNPIPSSWIIGVLTVDNQLYRLQVSHVDTVDQLKSRILNQLRLFEYCIELTCKAGLLNNPSSSLHQCRIQNGDVIAISLCWRMPAHTYTVGADQR